MSKIQVAKLHTLSGHKDSIYTIEGLTTSKFVSGAGDGMVVLWDLDNPQDGQLIVKLENSIYAIHAETGQNHLLVGHNYDGIHVVDWQHKKELGSLSFTKAAIFSIASHRGIAYVGTGDGEIVIINIHELKIINRIKLSDQRVRSIAINPLHGEIAIGYSDATIRILDLMDHRVKKELTAHTKSIFKVSYSADYRTLLSTSRDAHLIVWDVVDDYKLQQDIVAHMYAINDLTFNSSGTLFATCSMDKSIKVWDATTYKLLKVIDKARHAGHGTSVNKLWWHNEKDLLVSASDDRSISVWEINASSPS
jgi:WD40 repeat protein